MAKPPGRKKYKNKMYECGPDGCKPKSLPPGSSVFDFEDVGRYKTKEFTGPRFDTEIERMPEEKKFYQPQTDVMLDIEEITAGGGKPQTNKQLFRGTYQEAQERDALKAAGEASKTFTPGNFGDFSERSRKALLRGGADKRTVSPTSELGKDPMSITGQPITKVKEQALRQQLGSNYDMAKEGKVMSKTRYRTDPKTGQRTPVKKTMYDQGTVTEINLETGRAIITDLTTGKQKYTKTPEIEVQKKPREGVRKVAPMEESIIEKEGHGSEPVKTKKPGFFSKEAKRARRRRKGKSYAPGGRGRY